MANESFIVYLNLIVSSAVLIFIIWDHLKDDRLLTRQIQEFYSDIEMLIYSYIQVMYYRAIEKKEIEITDQKALIKTRNRDIIQNSYLKTKILQNFNKFSSYLGLTINKEESIYLNNTIYILTFDGLLKKRNFENNSLEDVLSSYIDIKNEEVSDILKFLNSLRFYWKKNFRKLIFRTPLNQKVNFFELLGISKPLEAKKSRVTKIRYKLKQNNSNNN
ncbi:MAG: hypothetical protein ACFE8J_17670 [Candidatus Heimdallarchaeota archaeon]